MSRELGLYSAACKGSVERLRALLARGADPTWCNEEDARRSALHVACHTGHSECVETLIATPGVDVNTRDRYDHTPLFLAAQAGHACCVVAVLESPEAKPNLASDTENATPLWIASYLGHTDCVDALLDDERTEVDKPSSRGLTALGGAALSGNAECIEALLLDGRADVNYDGCDSRCTPLFMSCELGNPRCVVALSRDGRTDLERGSRSANMRPFEVAVSRGRYQCASALLEAGVSDNLEGRGLMLSSESSHPALRIRCLLAQMRQPWTVGRFGNLWQMPPWVKRRAVTAVLCLRLHGLPSELIDAILGMCTARTASGSPAAPTMGLLSLSL